MISIYDITPAQLGLLLHTLGLKSSRNPHRNYFMAGDEHSDMQDLVALVAQELMIRRPNPEWLGGGSCFLATEAGKALALANQPPEKKRTRYDQFLDADYGGTFAEWMGIDKPQRESGYGDNRGMVRLVSRRATGGFALTLKEAKVSYKAALAKRQADDRAAKEFAWAVKPQ